MRTIKIRFVIIASVITTFLWCLAGAFNLMSPDSVRLLSAALWTFALCLFWASDKPESKND